VTLKQKMRQMLRNLRRGILQVTRKKIEVQSGKLRILQPIMKIFTQH
jgi:septum formation topological specificity factor MinE